MDRNGPGNRADPVGGTPRRAQCRLKRAGNRPELHLRGAAILKSHRSRSEGAAECPPTAALRHPLEFGTQCGAGGSRQRLAE
jgi:hypothetical protein